MKQILLVFAGALIFSACKKENNAEMIGNLPPTTPINASTPNPISNYHYYITYSIAMGQQDPAATLYWNAGYITTNSISFEGFQNVGDREGRVYLASNTPAKADLFADGMIGKVVALPGSYKDINYKITLGQNATSATFCLSGFYMRGDIAVPVQFIVMEPVQLTAQWMCCTAMSNAGITIALNQNYQALFSINPKDIATGITAEMLSGAVKENGTIIISQNSNQGVYQILRNNLNTNVAVTLNSSNPTPVPAIAAATY